MEANAIYFGATPVIALYQGIRLIWTGFELPVQNGTKLTITQAYQAIKAGTALKLDSDIDIIGYEAPIWIGDTLVITEVLGAVQNNEQVVIE